MVFYLGTTFRKFTRVTNCGQTAPVASLSADQRTRWKNQKRRPANESLSKTSSNTSKESVVQELVEMFRKLNLNSEKGDPLRNEFVEELEEDDMEKWCTIEEDESVRTAIADDITEDMTKLTLMDDEEENVATEDDVTLIGAPMLPVADLCNLFQPLRAAAFDLNLPDAGYYLSRALSIMQGAARARAPPRRQSLITESPFFNKATF